MEKAFAKAEELANNIKEYVNNRIDSVKLSMAEKVSRVIANVVAGLVVIVVLLLFIVFASVALSLALGEWLGETWIGFLLVGSVYLLIGIIVWAARGRLIQVPVINALIQQLFKNDEED